MDSGPMMGNHRENTDGFLAAQRVMFIVVPSSACTFTAGFQGAVCKPTANSSASLALVLQNCGVSGTKQVVVLGTPGQLREIPPVPFTGPAAPISRKCRSAWLPDGLTAPRPAAPTTGTGQTAAQGKAPGGGRWVPPGSPEKIPKREPLSLRP